MNTEKATPELFAALALAQATVENADKKSKNSHFGSKYADLAEVLNTVRPVLSANGLSILQSTEFDGKMVSVTTVLAHKGGGYLSSRASCVPAKTDGQGIGSATTYLRRYSLAAMAGVAQEDDDGNSAAHKGKPADAITPDAGVAEAMDKETIAKLEQQAAIVMEHMDMDDVTGAVEYMERNTLSADEQVVRWKLLPSHARTALKKHNAKKETA